MPGLLRGMARVAVAQGTATAVRNGVTRRQAQRWADQGEAAPAYMTPIQTAPADSAPAPPPPPPAAPAAEDPIAQLERLGQLRDKGVLTDEEFAAQKARLLG